MHGHFNSATFPALMRQAQEAGQHGMQISIEAAEKRDPLFREKAESAILRHLQASPEMQCDGETLVDVAKAHGAVPHSDRAFGAVFQSLARRGLIRTVGFGLRRKGNGTAGARIWGLCQ
jgi:hypothetical protein